jgi:titin
VTARVVHAPAAPHKLAAKAHGITISLSWPRVSFDGNDPALTYVLETSTDEETWETLEAATTALSYVHTGLDLSTTYYYRLSARNSIGLSEPSSTATATTWESLSAPDAPKNLTGIAAGTTINLSWEAPESDGGVTISGYRVESSTDGETWTELASSVTGTAYAHTGLTLGTTYHYQVSARNSEGLGTPSDATSVTALETVVAPGKPRNVTAASTGRHTVVLSWDLPASDGGASVTGYKIERRSFSESWSDVEADTGSLVTSYDDSGLDAGTAYFYRVSAINVADTVGAASPRAKVRTDPSSVPSAPLNVQAEGGTEEPRVAVWWDPPADDGGSTSFKGYRVEESVGTGDERNWVELVDRFPPTYLFIPFAELGTTRTYRVRARNSVGPGPWSDEVTITVPPGPPRDLTVTLDGPKFKLAWRAPGSSNGAEITGYKIEASTDQETWVADPDTVTTLHHTLSGLNYGVTYYFRVSAINSAGTGAASATAIGQVSCAVWCATATLSDHSSDTDLVGYSTADVYSGSTLTPNTFTYGDVEYTVGSFVNNTSNGSVEISLSPTLTESAKGALTLHLGSVELPFSSATSIGGLVTWLPSALGLSDFSFADGDSIRLLMTASESAED